jgi:hypothetical protein
MGSMMVAAEIFHQGFIDLVLDEWRAKYVAIRSKLLI